MSVHREMVQSMKPLDAVEYLLEVIEINRDIASQEAVDQLGIHFSRSEALLLRYLYELTGKVVSKDALFDALYAEKPVDDIPYPKIIDVFLCKIKRKLKNTGWSIRTVHGQGVALDIKNSDCGADTQSPQTTSLKLSGCHELRSFQE